MTDHKFTKLEVKLIDALAKAIDPSGASPRGGEELLTDIGMAGITTWVDGDTLTYKRVFKLNFDRLAAIKKEVQDE